MAIIRTKHTEQFTVIGNDLINDPRLDYRDLGILIYLLSKPDNWEVSTEHLRSIKKSGRDAVWTSLKAIVDAGYATRKPNPKGGWIYEIYDKSIIPNTEKPNTEKPNTEKPNTEKPTLINTDNKQILKEKVITEHTHSDTQKPATEKKPRACEVKNDSCEILDKDQQACLAWAMLQPFWSSQVKDNPKQFLKLYHSSSARSLKVQFEDYLQAKKNRDAATNNDHGSTNNSIGGNYGTKPARQPASTSHFSDPSYYRSGTADF